MSVPAFQPAWARLVAAWPPRERGIPAPPCWSGPSRSRRARPLDLPAAASPCTPSARAGAARSRWSASPVRRRRGRLPRPQPSAGRPWRRAGRPLLPPRLAPPSATRASTSTCGGTSRSTSTPPTTPPPRSTRWSTSCLDGRFRVSSSLPAPLPPCPPSRPARGAVPRRAVLFAAYDADGLVDDTVVAYVARAGPARRRVRALRRRGRTPAQLARLDGLARGPGRCDAVPMTSAPGATWPRPWSAGTRWRPTTRSCWPTTRAGWCARSTRSSRGWTHAPATSGRCS